VSPSLRKIMLLTAPDSPLQVLPVQTVPLPVDGYWRVVHVSAQFNAAAAAAVPVVTLQVIDVRSVGYWQAHVNCGVAAYDGAFSVAKDAQANVPTIDTHAAIQPSPSNPLDCRKGLRLVITGSAGGDVAQLSNLVVVIEKVGETVD